MKSKEIIFRKVHLFCRTVKSLIGTFGKFRNKIPYEICKYTA